MDREPFATYRTYPRGLMADGFVDGKQYAYLSVTQAKHQIPIINDAHEARVKEAVREAVAERDARIAELEKALQVAIEGLDAQIRQWNCLAGGIDIYADPDDTSPEDSDAHVGGLSVQMINKALAEINSVLGKEAKP